MRLIICGGRDFEPRGSDMTWLESQLAALKPDVVVHGACPTGADAFADWFARLRGFKVEKFRANWGQEGLAAGPRRNQRMIDSGADAVIAFPGGKGTADCVARAKLNRIPVIEAPR